MSRNVITIDQAPPADAFVPTNTVAPGCLISGTPNERGVRQFTSDDGKASAGVWACDTYHEHIPEFPTDELFFVLEGTVTITEAGSEPQTYGPGGTPSSSAVGPSVVSTPRGPSARSTWGTNRSRSPDLG